MAQETSTAGGLTTDEVLAPAAKRCRILDRARLLAEWVGANRELTPMGLLLTADTLEAIRLLKLDVPSSGRLRSQLDHDELMSLWSAAIGAGFLQIVGGRAYPGSGLRVWTSGSRKEQLGVWERAFKSRTAYDETGFDGHVHADGVAAVIALRVLGDSVDGALDFDELVDIVNEQIENRTIEAEVDGEDGIDLLEDFAAVDVEGDEVLLTPLGYRLSTLD